MAIDLRAAGLLRAIAHDPTLVAWPEALSLDVSVDGDVNATVDASFVARFSVEAIEAPGDLRSDDRKKMLDNMRGSDVLDGALSGDRALRPLSRYAGGRHARGDLVVRGLRRPMAMVVRVTRERQRMGVRGSWEGSLTNLVIRPFHSLLGALRLDDWLRLRLEARFEIIAAA